MTEADDLHTATDTPGHATRLRNASLAFNVGTLLIVSFPAVDLMGLFWPHGVHVGTVYALTAILVWLWGGAILARDPHLKVLMPFGARRSRESAAESQQRRVVLDEFDFHLRGEAFRISYEIVTALVALIAIGGLFVQLAGVRVEWGPVLVLTFPFGILWLMGLPTSVVVWLSNPAADPE